jgi:hypothetical protein
VLLCSMCRNTTWYLTRGSWRVQLAEYELLILSQNRFLWVSRCLIFSFLWSVYVPFQLIIVLSEFNLIFQISLNTVVLNQKLKTVSNYSQALLLRSEVSCSYRKNLHVNLHGRQDTWKQCCFWNVYKALFYCK